MSLKGLAKYIEASPAGQRKVLKDFKYPKDDEPAAMRMYYQDAVKKIQAFHKAQHPPEFLRSAAETFTEQARANAGSRATRFRNNARAVRQYEEFFGSRVFDVRSSPRMVLNLAGVDISVVPDLHVLERGRVKLIKLEFSADEPSVQTIKTITQGLYEAALQTMPDLPTSGVLLLDVATGAEHKGARAGARTLREMEAACQTISEVWDRI